MKNMGEKNFRNYMAGDPFLANHARVNKQKERNFCACGLNASGEAAAEVPDTENDLKKKVQKVTVINYAKTALLIIGVFVVGKYLYHKFVK